MKSFKNKIYFHREKEENQDIKRQAEELNFEETKNLFYLGYEIELEVEIFEDGSNKVLSIEGKDISELNLSI